MSRHETALALGVVTSCAGQKTCTWSETTKRYAIVPSDFEDRLVKQMHVHAAAHPRWGYRKVHQLLVDDGWAVNAERIERLSRAEGLRVPPRRRNRPNGKGIGEAGNSAWERLALRPGHICL